MYDPIKLLPRFFSDMKFAYVSTISTQPHKHCKKKKKKLLARIDVSLHTTFIYQGEVSLIVADVDRHARLARIER